MLVAAFVGPSGSGKTTLIRELIRRFVAEGRTIGAIKHTHHFLNEERRGDTGTFLEAGALPVILAGEGEAVLFRDAGAERLAYRSPDDLLQHFQAEIVLVEGFKAVTDWPRIEMDAETRITVDEALARLRAAWQSEI